MKALAQVHKSEEVKHWPVIRDQDQELSTGGSITDEVIDSMDIIDTAEEVYMQLMDNEEEDRINTSIVLQIGLVPMEDAMPYLFCLDTRSLLIDVFCISCMPTNWLGVS